MSEKPATHLYEPDYPTICRVCARDEGDPIHLVAKPRWLWKVFDNVPVEALCVAHPAAPPVALVIRNGKIELERIVPLAPKRPD